MYCTILPQCNLQCPINTENLIGIWSLRQIPLFFTNNFYIWIHLEIKVDKIVICTNNNYSSKVNVKWSRYRPDVAQRVGRGIALLFHDRGTRRGWVVSSTPRPHFTSGKDSVPIVQEAGWAPGPVWTGGKSRPHRDSIPNTYLNLWKYVFEFLLE